MTNKTQTVVVDGVKYSLTSEGYNKLQTLLNGSDVLEKVLPNPAPVTKLKDVLSWHYNEVVKYNCTTFKVLNPIYNSYKVDNDVTREAKKLKLLFSTLGIKLAYVVLKQINTKDFPGRAKFTQPGKDIHTDATGRHIIYNFVIKDNEGNLKMMFPGWLGLRSCYAGNMLWVFFCCVRDVVHKNAIMRAYRQQNISR